MGKTPTIRFEELTHEQLLALTDVQVQRYVDLASAEAGVPLMPERAPVEPVTTPVEPDVVTYTLAGLWFLRREEAEAVAAAMNAAERVRMEYEYRHHVTRGDTFVVPDTSLVEVSEQRVFSEGLYNRKREVLEEADRAEAAYKRQRADYDSIVTRRRKLSEGVRLRIDQARALEQQRLRLRAEFERYLELADCNVAVARRFLLKAYPGAQEDAPGLFSDAPPPDPPRALDVRHEERRDDGETIPF